MKNLKKLLAVALSLAILLTLTVPVMAAELTAAEKVELLGILQGEGDGVTDEYLAKATTRINVPFFCYAYWAKKMKPWHMPDKTTSPT